MRLTPDSGPVLRTPADTCPRAAWSDPQPWLTDSLQTSSLSRGPSGPFTHTQNISVRHLLSFHSGTNYSLQICYNSEYHKKTENKGEFHKACAVTFHPNVQSKKNNNKKSIFYTKKNEVVLGLLHFVCIIYVTVKHIVPSHLILESSVIIHYIESH